MTTQRSSNHFMSMQAFAPMLIATVSLAACEAHVGEGPEAPPYTNAAGNGDNAETADNSNPNPGQGLSLPNNSSSQSSDAGVSNNNSSNSGSAKNTNSSSNNSSNNNASAKNSNSGAGSNTPTSPPSASATPNTSPGSCAPSAKRAETALTTFCSGCHGPNSPGKGGFNKILDVQALIDTGKVVEDAPDDSVIFKRMSAGSMPPSDVTKRPADSDIEAIKQWIACGAPDWADSNAKRLEFVSIDGRLRTVLDDLRSVTNPVDRERIRYIDISNLANAGASDEQLQVYRESVSFLLNSLSRGRTVVAPEAIDKDKLLYRFDLRDYDWDETTWNQLEDVYPYAVVYDPDSRLFPFDEDTAEQIREETNTNIPVIQGDWFISHASRPPLYHTLLELPETLQELEQDLGVDIDEDIDTEQVLRSGFANAGPSQNNRVIERHELGGDRGALWVSYDFANNLDDRNIFANPLDFQEDGGEMIFNLDNGLQGYFVANAAGQRLDKAPNNIVQDPASRDGAVENGLSCMNCHQEDGQLPHPDEIRDFQLNSAQNARELEEVLALYADNDTLQDAFEEDADRYRDARAALGIKNISNTTMHSLDDIHLGILDLEDVASVIGVPAEELQRSIDASPQAFPGEIVTLRTKGGGIQRDSFESIVADVVEGMGLGEQLLVRNNRVVNSNNVNSNNVNNNNVNRNVNNNNANNNNANNNNNNNNRADAGTQ